MTYAQLVAEIRSEAQLDNDVAWDVRILSFLNEEFINLASLQNHEQLHLTRKFLLTADQDGATKLVLLPADFLKVDFMRFATSLNTWRLPKNNGIVPPRPEQGKPGSYELHTSIDGVSRIRLIPESVLTATDAIELSYFTKPLLRVAGDVVAPESWMPTMKRVALERALNYHIGDPARQADTFAKMNQQSAMGAVMVPKEIEKPEKAYDSPRSA